MEPASNDTPAHPESSGASGVPFGAPKPFTPALSKLPPKLRPEPLVSEKKLPTFKLPLKPPPDASASTDPHRTEVPPVGKIVPPGVPKPVPKLSPVAVAEPFAKLAPDFTAKPATSPKALPKLSPKPAPKLAPAIQAEPLGATPQQPEFKSPPLPPKPASESETASPSDDEEDLNEIFREEVDSYLNEMVTALNQVAGDHQNVEAWALLKTKYHALKGAANTVGLPDLGTVAAEAEQVALAAKDNSANRNSATHEKLVAALRSITQPLDIPFPELIPFRADPQETSQGNPSADTRPHEPSASPATGNDELAVPDIEPVIIAFSEWQQVGTEAQKQHFLAEAANFHQSLNADQFSGLQRSFAQLIEFCRKPITVSPPPPIFCAVISHALNDARIYLDAKRFNPKLTWSRKWHFYFSSLQIAMASYSTADQTSREQRDPEMVEAFLEEAGDHLQHIEEGLIAWESGQRPEERQAELRRHFHTLKGAANSVGLTDLGADFHILEDALDQADTATAARDFLPHLFTCLDEARRYAELLQTDPQCPWFGNWGALLHPDQPKSDAAATTLEMQEAIDPDMLEVFVEEADNLLEPIESATMSLEAGEQPAEQQNILRRHFHTLKGAANSVGLTSLGSEFHALEDFMDGELANTDPSQLTSFLLQCLDQLRAYSTELQSNPKAAWPYGWAASITALKQGESTPPTNETVSPKEQAAAKLPSVEKQTLRVEASQLQELMHMISELVAEQNKIQHYVQGLRSLHGNLQQLYSQTSVDSAAREQLQKLAEEANLIKDSLDQDDQLFRRYSKRIQSDLLELNMGPVGSLFHRLSRSFRDACKEEQKQASWNAEGGDVQLDRSVVDQLYGPLLHVVRNAVAHGIESPEKRQEAGKDPSGTVNICAISKADHVVIEISDDGAGINTDAVRRKAVEKGLLDASVTSITSDEAVELLFSPGFSTKDAVSNVAGRGVGLDVVKGDIEALNGSVGVNNHEGQGTTWIIRVPLTLSASEALLVYAGEFKIALPLSMVERCTRLSSGHMDETTLIGRITIDDEPIPLLNLTCFLKATSSTPPTHAVVIDSGLERAALAVTGLDNRREIVMKDLGALLSPLAFYSGVTSDVDGSLLPVIQIPYLLNWILKHELRNIDEVPTKPEKAPLQEEIEETGQPPEQVSVLLADDSPSVRKVQEKQLTRLGFAVNLAKDGQEALDFLKNGTADLLITDWEMPRVDGAELVNATRENPETRHLPIIVISSKVNDTFEAEATRLGATACLAKPFQANQFLEKLKSTPELLPVVAKLEAFNQYHNQ